MTVGVIWCLRIVSQCNRQQESQWNNNHALKQCGLALLLQRQWRENMSVSKRTDLPLWPLTFSQPLIIVISVCMYASVIFNSDNHCYSPLSTAKSSYHVSVLIVKMIEESWINVMFKILCLFTSGIRVRSSWF